MTEPVPPGGTPDPRLSRPVPDVHLDPADLPAVPAVEPAPPAPPVDPDVSTPRIEATLDAPSPDVVLPDAAATLPGAHRGGFANPPTAPIEVAVVSGPELEEFVPTTGTATIAVATSASWNPGAYALLFTTSALVASFVVGWLLPLGVVGIVFAVIALRRHGQRRMGAWALALGILSVIYSAGWLIFAAVQGGTA